MIFDCMIFILVGVFLLHMQAIIFFTKSFICKEIKISSVTILESALISTNQEILWPEVVSGESKRGDIAIFRRFFPFIVPY